ncbi:MAG: uroporphyrinogen decarboxylase family protein [Lachnospiraceae bacterium]|nr:uroporphyrinogen decarboxylase family protein [Lachnospiraceae bacterium]
MFSVARWKSDILSSTEKKAMPVLSFPAVQLLDISVKQLISESDIQAAGMKAVADRCPDAMASVNLMDLSVEAQCFGAPIRYSDDEVPTCMGPVIDPDDDEDEHLEAAQALEIPAIGSGRTDVYINAIKKAKQLITDRPVFAGCIGPFSLAGRIVDVTNSLVFCLTEPDYMHIVISKAAEFITGYIKAFKEAGADGVVMAEPLAGLLSPSLAGEFSGEYCRRISEAVKDDSFAFIYHNCGNTAAVTIDSILEANADAYHFGNAVNMEEIMQKMPSDVICMGNVDPAGQFMNGTPESIRQATLSVMEKCCRYPNFVISSGCDIPPKSGWDNIDAFYAAVNEFYGR